MPAMPRRPASPLLVLWAVGVLAGRPLPAQFGETLEVTASAEPGPSVVITREEIEKLPAGDLHQVLALLLPGGVARRAPFGAQADARLRGAGFESVQVLVDGVPVMDPQTGHFTLDFPVRPEAVESIEVVPRAWTTAPGGPAAGGAILITTRKDTAGRAGIEGGEHALAQGSAGWGLKGEQWAVRGTAGRTTHAGWTEDTELSDSGAAVSGSAGPLRWTAAVRDAEFGALNFYSTRFPYQWEGVRSAFGTVGARVGGVDLQAYWRRHDDDFILDRDRPMFYRNEHTSERLGAQASGALGGLGWQIYGYHESVEGNRLEDHARDRGGASMLWRGGLGPGALWLGGALEAGEGGDLWAPRLGYRLPLGRAVDLWASVAGGRRLPSFTELYYQSPTDRGDPGLDIPSISEGEVGLEGKGWSLALWGRRHRDEIDWVMPEGAAVYYALNLPDYTACGTELRWRLPWATLFLAAQEVREPLPLETLKYLGDHPQVEAGVILPLAWKGFGATVTVRAVEPAVEEAYATADLRLTYGVKAVRFHLDAYNLFDAAYQERRGVDMPGRWVSAGVTAAF
jgi:iron complex outermembrane receptor protein